MTRHNLTWVAALLLGVSLAGCRKPTPTPAPPQAVEQPSAPQLQQEAAPKRIIFFIGDGMGVAQLTAAQYAKGEVLEIMKMPWTSLITTHEHEFLTTDSAAAATALATGHKTHFEALSVTAGTTQEMEEDPAHHLHTLTELAHAHGLRGGLVATSRINHATPGAFGAHRSHRQSYEAIADDMSKSSLSVLLGAGAKAFNARSDGRDLLGEMVDGPKGRGQEQQAGWATATTVEELDAIDPAAQRVAALLAPSDFPYVESGEQPMSLSEMTTKAIEVLDRDNDAGWVLMVEGSFIDWCGHDLNGACAAVETIAMDEAVGVARAYAAQRDDTLIVVTADHETGAMSVLDPPNVARFTKLLGGEDGAAELVAQRDEDGALVRVAPPVQHVVVGARSSRPDATPLVEESLGLTHLDDARFTMVVGNLSLASRPYWRTKRRFSGAHTPALVSLHAEGPGARAVVQARDNADLGRVLRDLVAAAGEGTALALPTQPTQRPKNVVVLIGDGLGVGSITAAHYWHGGLRMLEMPVVGLSATHAADAIVNGSAASATAIATGYRTLKNAVGRRPDGDALVDAATVLELAEQRGLATGLVTTTALTHATTAAFFAHRDNRSDTEGIVADLLTLRERAGAPEVLFGGGARHVDEAARAALTAQGYAIATSWPPAGDSPILGMFAHDAMARAAVRVNDGDDATPTLTQMTEEALRRLADHDDGFFLMVEGGQIDWRMHEAATDTSVLAEVVEFDDAVAHVLAWAAQRDDTLVIVTSDHDHSLSVIDNHYAFKGGHCGVAEACGGPLKMQAIPVNARALRNADGFAERELQGDFGAPKMFLQYPWLVHEARKGHDVHAPHAANFVPIFAEGPMSEQLGGFVDQPQIGEFLLRWVRGVEPD